MCGENVIAKQGRQIGFNGCNIPIFRKNLGGALSAPSRFGRRFIVGAPPHIVHAMRFAEAIAGGGSGALVVLLLHPLDTLKTVLQSSSSSGQTNARAAAFALARGGLTPFYRGAGPALVGSASSWAIYFHSFYTLRRVMNSDVTTGARDMVAAAAAGCFTAALTNPIWMVKTRMQLAGGYRDAAHTVRCMARDEGVRAFYRGLGPSLWLVSNASIQFALYERLKSILGEGNAISPTTTNTAIASAVSKLVATSITYPLQVVRTRVQEPNAIRNGYTSFPATFRRVAMTEGPRAFYRGLFANLLRVVPQASLTLVLYESIFAQVS